MIPECSLRACAPRSRPTSIPTSAETLGAAQAVREVRAGGGGLAARIALGFPVGGYQDELTAALAAHLAAAGIARR